MSTSPAFPIVARTDSGSRIREAAWVWLWLRRWRDRQALRALHPEQMRDVGLTGYDVRREAEKPVWRA